MSTLQPAPDFSPIASIVLVHYKSFETCAKPCLSNLFSLTEFAELEIILVDNASGTETTDKIEALISGKSNVKFIRSKTNRGFPGGVNDGVANATGDIIFNMALDSIVPDGAIKKLIGYIQDNPSWIVGPVMSNSGNEQKIYTQSEEISEILQEGAEWCKHTCNSIIKLQNMDFTCIGMKRNILEDIGPLDEGFGLGYYEDADFCRRANQKNHPLMMIEDIFIYHKGGGQNLSTKELMRSSRKYFLKKHGKAGHSFLLLTRQRDVNLRTIDWYFNLLEHTCVEPKEMANILYRAKNRLQLAGQLWPKNPFKKLAYSKKMRAIKAKLSQYDLLLND